MDPQKTSLLKTNIIHTFTHWIKLKLPLEVFPQILTSCPNLIDLVFLELSCEEDESLQEAMVCLVELISISRRPEFKFQDFMNKVVTQIDSLSQLTENVISSGDFEKADYFAEIFAEIALTNLD